MFVNIYSDISKDKEGLTSDTETKEESENEHKSEEKKSAEQCDEKEKDEVPDTQEQDAEPEKEPQVASISDEDNVAEKTVTCAKESSECVDKDESERKETEKDSSERKRKRNYSGASETPSEDSLKSSADGSSSEDSLEPPSKRKRSKHLVKRAAQIRKEEETLAAGSGDTSCDESKQVSNVGW